MRLSIVSLTYLPVPSNEEEANMAKTEKTVTVIVNPTAGFYRREITSDSLRALFALHGLAAEILLVSPGQDITLLAQAANAKGSRTVIAGGGDGTVSSVAAGLACRDAILGILPLGTLNHFAKQLGIPSDIREAVRVIAEGAVEAVDTAEVNGRIFLNNSSLGVYPLLVWERRQLQRKGLSKLAAFLLASLNVLKRPAFVTVRLRGGSEESVRTTPFVFVGNNEYEIEGRKIGMRLRLDGGDLAVYVAPTLSRAGFVGLFLKALFSKLKREQQFDLFITDKLLIEAGRKQLLVAFDGEISRMTSPLRYQTRPGALKVIVPGKL